MTIMPAGNAGVSTVTWVSLYHVTCRTTCVAQGTAGKTKRQIKAGEPTKLIPYNWIIKLPVLGPAGGLTDVHAGGETYTKTSVVGAICAPLYMKETDARKVPGAAVPNTGDTGGVKQNAVVSLATRAGVVTVGRDQATDVKTQYGDLVAYVKLAPVMVKLR